MHGDTPNNNTTRIGSTDSSEERAQPTRLPSRHADQSENRTDLPADTPIEWFRQASPYIKAYRDTTLVLHIDGALLESPQRSIMAQDIALLSHLGIRLILVPGLRRRINKRLSESGIQSTVSRASRVTDSDVLGIVRSVAGEVRIELESLLSMGLTNTPMAGAHLSVVSGNFVTAQPIGVREGVDYGFSGVVRKIHQRAIDAHTASGHIVLLPPLGYSRTGELFNLQSELLAAETAAELNAEKLVYLSSEQISDNDDQPLAEATPEAIREQWHATSDQNTDRLALLGGVLHASDTGVSRVHVLDCMDSNALLQELFSRDGAGTLVSAADFDTIRPASIDDVGGIIELIEPLEKDGTLIPRSREQLELEIDNFHVCEREGMVTACAALICSADTVLYQGKNTKVAEIACLVTHPSYREGGRAEQLLSQLSQVGKQQKIDLLFVLTTRTGHWFIERGFSEAGPELLPQSKEYSLQRNSKVLVKPIAETNLASIARQY